MNPLADFDKEVMRTRSQLKDVLDWFYSAFILDKRIDVPLPLGTKHTLTLDEKRWIRRVVFEALDELEPMNLLITRKMLYNKLGIKRREIPDLAYS